MAEVSPYLDEALAMPAEERAAGCLAAREQPRVASMVEALLDEHRLLEEEHFLEHCPAQLPDRCCWAKLRHLYPDLRHWPRAWQRLAARRNDGRFERKAAVKLLNLALMGERRGTLQTGGRILAS